VMNFVSAWTLRPYGSPSSTDVFQFEVTLRALGPMISKLGAEGALRQKPPISYHVGIQFLSRSSSYKTGWSHPIFHETRP
jgi:hypothetical protein